jgi:hypothetical protein
MTTDAIASEDSSETLRKTTSGVRRFSAAGIALPSANSSVSTPAPCRMSDRKCRMLESASMTKKSGTRASLPFPSAAGGAAAVAADVDDGGVALITRPVPASREHASLAENA